MKLAVVAITLFWAGPAFSRAAEADTPPASVKPATRPASRTAEEVAARLAATVVEIRSIKLSYHTAPDPVRDGAQVWVDLRQGRPDRLSMAIRHGSDSIPPDADPFATRYLVGPQAFRIEEPFNRESMSSPLAGDAELPGSLRGEFWCNATGIWILDSRPSPSIYGVKTSLARMTAGKIRLEPAQVELPTGWCHVLHSDHDGGSVTYWVDMGRGPSVLKKEVAASSKRVSYQFGDFVEINTGQGVLYSPRHVHADFYENDRRVSQTDVSVSEFIVNDLNDSEFRPATACQERIDPHGVRSGPRRVDREHLESLGRWLRTYYHSDLRRTRSPVDGIGLVYFAAGLIPMTFAPALIARCTRARSRDEV